MLSQEQIRELIAEVEQQKVTLDRDDMAIPSYLHRNPLVRWIIRRRLQVIADILKSLDIDSFLDFGCGVGVLAQAMAEHCQKVCVTDLSLEPVTLMVVKYNLAKKIMVIKANDLESDIADHSLDAVVAADVLEHIEDESDYIRLFCRKLKPQGVLIISGPTENIVYSLCRKIAGFSGDYHKKNIYDIEENIKKLGLRLVKVDKIPSCGLIHLFRVTRWQIPKFHHS